MLTIIKILLFSTSYFLQLGIFTRKELLRSFIDLDFVPADLVGGEVQRKGILIGVNGGGLGLIGVVDDAVFAVFHKGVNLHMII